MSSGPSRWRGSREAAAIAARARPEGRRCLKRSNRFHRADCRSRLHGRQTNRLQRRAPGRSTWSCRCVNHGRRVGTAPKNCSPSPASAAASKFGRGVWWCKRATDPLEGRARSERFHGGGTVGLPSFCWKVRPLLLKGVPGERVHRPVGRRPNRPLTSVPRPRPPVHLKSAGVRRAAMVLARDSRADHMNMCQLSAFSGTWRTSRTGTMSSMATPRRRH